MCSEYYIGFQFDANQTLDAIVRRSRILSSKWNHVDDIPWSLGPPIFLFLRSCLWFLPLCERMCVFVYVGGDPRCWQREGDQYLCTPVIYTRCTAGGNRHRFGSVAVPDQDGNGMETSRSLILFINYYLIISL